MSGLQSHYLSSTAGDVHSTKDETEFLGSLSRSLFVQLIGRLRDLPWELYQDSSIALIIHSFDRSLISRLRDLLWELYQDLLSHSLSIRLIAP